jgi:molybdopterin synthase catalytic subunit
MSDDNEATIYQARPSLQLWLDEIKSGPDSFRIGMYLVHNGVVRGTARDGSAVSGMNLSYDQERLQEVVAQVEARPGVVAVRVWINEGKLAIGDDIMFALVAGDIRENVFGGLQELVRRVKSEVVAEWEIV